MAPRHTLKHAHTTPPPTSCTQDTIKLIYEPSSMLSGQWTSCTLFALVLPPGPTPTTISDFWQMIWDHKPAVIVMLTRVQENGKVSMLYWPGDMDHCLPLFLCTHCTCAVVCGVWWWGAQFHFVHLKMKALSTVSYIPILHKCCFLLVYNLICVCIKLSGGQLQQQQQWMAFVICSWLNAVQPQYAFALDYEHVPA